MSVGYVPNLPITAEDLVLPFQLLFGDFWLKTIRIIASEAEKVIN